VITFPDSEKVADGLQRYFDHYHFDNGGYDDKTFTVKFWGPLKVTFPNTKGRVEAVKLHDIHHMLTQYEANLRGESEIGAWEIGAGCGKYTAAWLLNAGSVFYGFLIWPGKVYKGFMWGRRCESLCHHTIYKEYSAELLSNTIGKLREQVRINDTRNSNYLKDNLLFVLMLLIVYLPVLIGMGVVGYLVWRFLI